LRVKIVSAEKGHVVIKIPLRKELLRSHNILHGGVILASADIAGGLAVFTVNNQGNQVTLDLKMNFLEPMEKGPFRCEAKVIRKGERIVLVDIEFKDAENVLGAKGLGTWYILKIS